MVKVITCVFLFSKAYGVRALLHYTRAHGSWIRVNNELHYSTSIWCTTVHTHTENGSSHLVYNIMYCARLRIVDHKGITHMHASHVA
jgi:hypothetical protein